MIKPIVISTLMLSQKARPAIQEDFAIADDLADTLAAHCDECVGMAANMIGTNVAIIAFYEAGKLVEMFNPEIVKASGSYTTEEGCLSLSGFRVCERYKDITVTYQDRNWRQHTKRYEGLTAEIIQHEVDHLHGIII